MERRGHEHVNVVKDPWTALMETKPIQVYTNKNRLKYNLVPKFDFICFPYK